MTRPPVTPDLEAWAFAADRRADVCESGVVALLWSLLTGAAA